jgi:hypothetical protein
VVALFYHENIVGKDRCGLYRAKAGSACTLSVMRGGK